MALREATIPARLTRPLIDLVRERRPESVPALLQSAGISPALLLGDAQSLPLSRYEALLTAAGALLDDTALALEVGRRITVDAHGALGQVLRGCATFDEILATVERCYRLVSPAFLVRYRRGRELCEWRVRIGAPMSSDMLRFFLEAHAVAWHNDLVTLFGAAPAADVYLSLAPLSHRRRYRELLPMRFHFAATKLPEMRCTLPTEWMMRPLPARTERLPLPPLPTRQSVTGYAAWCELMLREAEELQPSLEQLAEILSISPRTLSRKLAEEDANFRDIGNRVRHQRACELLEANHESVTQIAYRLGYADTTTFSRAFRHAAGVAPARFRQNAIGGPSRAAPAVQLPGLYQTGEV